MKKRTLVLAALAPLVAAGAANAAMDEMAPPEMRVWSAVLSEPGEAPGATLTVTASQSTTGSNSMVIESVALVSTEISKDEEGNMTETMSSVACQGPFPVEGGSFMVEATPMPEAGEMEGEATEEMAEAGEAEAEPCLFSVSGEVKHTYRSWHSWDVAGSVTMGEMSADFEIASPAPAMVLEPEPEEEMPAEEMSEEAEASS